MGIHTSGTFAAPTVATSLQAKARKLLRAAARAAPVTAAATPATVSQGGSGAASTIVTSATTGLNGPTIPWNDARLTDIGGIWTLDPDNAGYGFIANHVSNKTTGAKRNNVNGAGKLFGTDAQAFDVCTFGGPVRVCATDLATGLRQWYSTDVAVSSAFIYTKFDFGSRAARLVEVYFGGNSSFWGRGFNVGATDTVWQAARADAPAICVFGDSYGAGMNNDSMKSRYSDVLGERFGAAVITSAVSGSGYLTAVGGFTWRQRIANGDLDVSRIGEQDMLFAWGSINDGSQADANVQAEVTLAVQAMMSAQPNAILFLAGPQFTAAVQTPASRYAAVQAGVVAAAAGSARVIYVDGSPAGERWQTGSGKAGALTGSGNNDLYLASDGTHWNADGNRYGGRRIADSLIAKLAALGA